MSIAKLQFLRNPERYLQIIPFGNFTPNFSIHGSYSLSHGTLWVEIKSLTPDTERALKTRSFSDAMI